MPTAHPEGKARERLESSTYNIAQARPEDAALGLNEPLGPAQGCGQRLQVGLLRAIKACWCPTPNLHPG